MPKDILDAVYGCLIAGAIGDALGAPAENMIYAEVRKRYGKLTDFRDYGKTLTSGGRPGAVTDDTTLRHYMCLAIVRNGGRITPEDAAEVWLHDLNPDRFWSPDKISYLKMKAGVSPWDAGRGDLPSACATMAMPPIGIINAANPEQAFQDGYNIAAINGDGADRHAAAVVAAGVAAALTPDATVDTVLATMTRHSSGVLLRAVDLALDLAKRCNGVDDFVPKFYDQLLDWWSRPSRSWDREHVVQGTAVESVSIVMALLYLCGGDVNETLIEAASFGRDADTIAYLAGSIAGALQGAGAVRRDWVESCEKANRPFFEEVEGDPDANFSAMARRMVGALKSEREATAARLAVLDTLLA
jgi:ADP-ribosylglycohydrolase